MKICVLSPGVVHAVPRTIAFSKFFNEVHFIDTKGNADITSLSKNGIRYHSINNKSGKYQLLKIFRLLKNINPDGIVCHYASGNHFFASVLYGKCPVAVIAMGQDILYDKGDHPASFFERLLIRTALKMCVLVCAKSKTLKDRILHYGVKTEIPVIYWGSELTKFIPRDKNQIRQKLGYGLDTPILLSSRAVEPRCNIHLIIEAVAEITKKIPNAMLLQLGRTEPNYQRQVEALIAHFNLHKNIICIYEVDETQLIEYYSLCDVLISMANSEGFPNSVLEVMACNRPVVIGEIPQIRELLVDDYNAKFCSFDKNSISNSILDVLNNKEKAIFLSENGRKMALEKGNISKNGTVFANIFKNKVSTQITPKRSMIYIFFLLLTADFILRIIKRGINVFRRIFMDKIKT